MSCWFVSGLAWGQTGDDARIMQIEQKLLVLSSVDVPGLNETANLSVSNAPVQEFIRGLAETHNLNISMDPGLDMRVTNNFTNARVISILVFLCREYQLDIRVTGTILSFFRFLPPQPEKPLPVLKNLRLTYDTAADLLTVDLLNDSLTAFAKQVTQLSKRNVVLAPGLNNRLLNGYVEAIPFEAALDKIAFANNLKLTKTKDNVFLLKANIEVEAPSYNGNSGVQLNRPPNQGGSALPSGLSIDIQAGDGAIKYINLDAINMPIAQLIHEVSDRLGINYVLFSEPVGNTTTRVKHVSYDYFLSFLLQGTTHTYRASEGVYMIGDRSLEGFRTTKVVRMQFRPVEKLDETIPSELKKGVEIKLFKELNSVILSGGAPQIAEITEFLKAIDHPVVNVMIEVIVVEVNRSKSIRTGINAYLSDSLVKTGGTVFPGLDLTLGSKAINDFLGKLGSNGIVNLGRVTPNFYVTLQALEANSNVDIRSTPKLSTLNGHEANLTIGQSVYYLEQTQNINGGVSPIISSTQQYKAVKADLNIKINPMVSGDENITLTIDAEFSNFIAPTIKGAPPGNATRKFASMIRVKNEEMIVLGGLEDISNSRSGSGVPILSRIPILKWIFSSRVNEKRNNRLIIFVKPTLLF